MVPIHKYLKIIVIGILLVGCKKKDKEKPEEIKPNIVFILADDLGWNQIGYNGTTFYETPNIDKIGEDGIIFTNAYAAASICSPTRASIMTGKNPARLHLTDYIPGSPYPYAKLKTPQMVSRLDTAEVTIAEILKLENYKTGHFGKWHLNYDKNYKAGRVGDPKSQGFDVVLTTVKPKADADPSKDPHHTEEITREALKFIDDNHRQPFFAYVSYHTVHRPLIERPELIEKYSNKKGSKDSVNNPVMGAMIETMDKGIGRIIAKLESLGLSKNTIVVFYSDNGGLKLLQSQDPLRGGKAMIFEGGTRVPMAIKWPEIIKPFSKNNSLVTSDDFLPTLATIAQHKNLPENLDGLNLLPLLSGTETINRDALYWNYPHYHHLGYKPGSAMVSGDYKLIEWYEPLLYNQDGAYKLYNLAEDLGETTDLSEKFPEKVAELKEQLHKWQKTVGAQKMDINPNYDETKADWRFEDKKN